jgi:peptidylprolyl isomerase
VPEVSNATDLTKEPLPSPGTGPAPTQLVTSDLVVGTGATATATSTVEVQYVGTSYTTGKVFDSSWSRGQPATFALTGVVPGFAQGIEGMKVGGRRVIVIPPALGYGVNGSPPVIKPNETLVFVVDLLAVQ